MKNKLKKIKLLLMDVDGVLTDGRITIDGKGRESKSFHAHDGTGIKLLQNSGIQVGWITGRISNIVVWRAKELGVDIFFQEVEDKFEICREIMKDLKIFPNEVAYIGDDINDLLILQDVGFSVAVADAHNFISSKVDYVTTKEGGRGAVREVCDMIMGAQKITLSTLI